MGYRQTNAVGREDRFIDCFLEGLPIDEGGKRTYHKPVFLGLLFSPLVYPSNVVTEDDDIFF